MIRPLILFFALLSVLSAEPLRLVSPENGATVPLLSAEQKAYLDLPREERVRLFADPASRKTLQSYGWHPQKVVLSWAGYPDNSARPLYTVEVRRIPGGRPVFRADTVHHRVSVENLEVAAEYEWTVWERGAGAEPRSVTGSFRTEDRAPRLLKVANIPNIRDLGGRIGLDGRRVRQGLVFRSTGLNLNASEEDPETKTRTPGKTRIDDSNRSFFLDTLGIRTDIDLRSDDECYGMTGSPLGPAVTWAHIPTWSYDGFQDEWCRGQLEKILRLFLDPRSYPIDFHCIAGADRTGSLAFVLNALLGVDEEELWRDWEVTGFWTTEPNFNHADRFQKLVAGFDKWPGETLRERVEAYFFSMGFDEADLTLLRNILLEP